MPKLMNCSKPPEPVVLSLTHDEAKAAALLDEYVAFFEKYGRVTWADPDASRRIVTGDVAGLIDVVFAKGRYVGGVSGADDADLAQFKIAVFDSNFSW